MKVSTNFNNADRAARGNKYCTVHKDGGITFHGDPLATVLANMPSTPKEAMTIWKKPEDCVDEWARVLKMRKENPKGLVAGGRNFNPDFKPSFIENNEKRWVEKKDLERRGAKFGSKQTRHYASN